MKSYSLFKWLKNVSIAKKLYFTVGIMALLIGLELCTLIFALNTLSSVRAYVGGEGLWSKAQKDALFHLYKYGVGRNETDYRLFKDFMRVPLGDGKARREMQKPHPDMETAKQGFVEGRNHPDDTEGMVQLFLRFNKISYINKAIIIWGEAEPFALQLNAVADSLNFEINTLSPSQARITQLLESIGPINLKLTKLEDDFSYTLGEGSRWLEGLIKKLLFVIALTVEISGLILAISLSRSIQRGLNEIIAAAKSFAKGNLDVRAKVFSNDEIGVVANSFNQMSSDLQHSITALEKARTRFKDLIESAPDSIIILDRKGIIKLVNKQTEKLFQYSRNELLEKPVDVLIPDHVPSGEVTNSTSFIESAQINKLNIEVFGLKKNGKEFPVEINLSPLETEDGTLISASIRDLSERKHIKDLENKNHELEQFAYIASHDLQEPLDTITSFTMLLEDEFTGKMDKDAREYVDYIKQSSNRLRSLIAGLLEYSRIGKKSKLNKVDCNEMVRELLSDMKASIKVCNAKVTIGNLPEVTAYPVELRVVFQNLLSNAIKYHRKDAAPSVIISSHADDKNWMFTVEDNGIGIDPKYSDKIFIIFQRLHNSREFKGTGIGLAHCKKIIELHNGAIWMESKYGEGSKFHFSIPKNT
jgi:PAS domain S-box-containing protein